MSKSKSIEQCRRTESKGLGLIDFLIVEKTQINKGYNIIGRNMGIIIRSIFLLQDLIKLFHITVFQVIHIFGKPFNSMRHTSNLNTCMMAFMS